MGRPNKYNPACLESVTKYCILGCTDLELADYLGIADATLYEWKNKYPEFAEAIKAGKEDADMQVAEALRIKAVEGDTGAMVFWLKNRRKQHWRDKQENDVNLSGTVNQNLSIEFVNPTPE